MMTNSKQNYENYDQIVTQRVKMCEVVCTVFAVFTCTRQSYYIDSHH